MLASIALGADNPLGATTAKTIWRYAKTMFEIKMMELAIMMISYHINNLAKRPTLTCFTIWAKKLHTSMNRIIENVNISKFAICN